MAFAYPPPKKQTNKKKKQKTSIWVDEPVIMFATRGSMHLAPISSRAKINLTFNIISTQRIRAILQIIKYL